MNDSINQPVEIDLKDLFFFILKKIMLILVVACITAGIGAAYAFIKSNRYGDAIVTNVLNIEERLPDETDDEYNNRVTKVNQAFNVVKSISALSAQVERQNNYLANSILMQIDPSNTAMSDAQIVITVSDNAPEGAIQSIYSAYYHAIESNNYLDEVAQSLNCNPEQLSELITARLQSSSTQVVESGSEQMFTIEVQIVGLSTNFTEALMDSVLDEITSQTDAISDSVANHDLTISGRQSTVGYSDAVRSSQYNIVNYMSNLQNQINSQNGILDNIAKQLKLSDRNSFYDVSTANVNASSSTSTVKYGAIGFVVGAILVIVYFLIVYVFGKRIVSQGQFFVLFSFLKKIGVCKPSKKSILNRFTDDDSYLTKENNDKLIAANYDNLTQGLNKVLITGSVENDGIKKAIKSLDLKGDVQLDMFKNPDVLKKVSSYDGIVIVEQRDVSSKKNIRKQLELLNNSGTKIIGAIII